ncbi:hypothetical protein [Pseudomonas orientalis]|uniref:Uncharacterized protein n=1 Tax=Pseudomonas orientalis TaxID=76758 RepID=A0A2L0RTR3_9PSED|nr:hypothetical protein [Pseudomonas orientalis]AUZ45372.1 hypothetical protein BOP93_07095 [Pseudomonas orientalis]
MKPTSYLYHKETLTSFIQEEALSFLYLDLTSEQVSQCLSVLDQTIKFFNHENESIIFNTMYYSDDRKSIVNISVPPINAMHYYLLSQRADDLIELPATCSDPDVEEVYSEYLNYQIAYNELHSKYRKQFIEAWKANHNALYSYNEKNVIRGFLKVLNRKPTPNELKDFTK